MTKEARFGRLVAMKGNEWRMTQKQLAKKVGISRAQLANIELGHSRPSLDSLWNLSRQLRAHPGDFFVLLMSGKS